jgi:hypothetical protein
MANPGISVWYVQNKLHNVTCSGITRVSDRSVFMWLAFVSVKQVRFDGGLDTSYCQVLFHELSVSGYASKYFIFTQKKKKKKKWKRKESKRSHESICISSRKNTLCQILSCSVLFVWYVMTLFHPSNYVISSGMSWSLRMQTKHGWGGAALIYVKVTHVTLGSQWLSIQDSNLVF